MSHLGIVADVRDMLRSDLLQLLDSLPGKNLLIVWEKRLLTPVNMVVETAALKEHRVRTMYMIQEDGRIDAAPADCDTVAFLVSPSPPVVEHVARYVKDRSKLPANKAAVVVFVPNKTIPCENLLHQLKVDTRLASVLEFQLDMLPLDCDLLLCDQPNCFADYHLRNDISSLHYLSRAIMKLQFVFGIIPNIAGKGDAAKRVCDNILRMRREYDLEEAAKMPPQIDNLIIIDRASDLLTPVAPQLNFEGLIDEVYGIKYGRIVVNVPKDNGTYEEKKVTLNSADEQFADLRDRHISSVGKVLSRMTKNLSAQYDERHQATTVADLKKIVSKLPHMQAAKQSLAIFTTVTEKVKEHTDSDEYMDVFECQLELVRGYETDRANAGLETLISTERPLSDILRLLCVQSFCNGGLKPKLLQHYVREIVHVYGVDKLLTLQNLARAGLVVEQKASSPKSNYSTVKTTLQLCPDDVNEESPRDIHYVTGGYAPLSVRMVQRHSQPGWRSVRELLQSLPGGQLFETQQLLRATAHQGSPAPLVFSGEKKLNLVVFVGGVTYSELTALRYLSQMEDFPANYLVLTTGLLNSSTFLDSLTEQPPVASVNPFM